MKQYLKFFFITLFSISLSEGATVYMGNGKTVECEVVGYEEAQFRFRMPDGKEFDVHASRVKAIDFGHGVRSMSAKETPIVFRPSSAEIKGKGIKLDSARDVINYWSDPKGELRWNFEVPKSGHYRVILEYASGKGNSGSELRISSKNESLEATVNGTRDWGNFMKFEVGRLNLWEGESELKLRVKKKRSEYVADFKSITLIWDEER